MKLRHLVLPIAPVLLWVACSGGSGEPTETPTAEVTSTGEATSAATNTPDSEDSDSTATPEPTSPPGNPAIEAVTDYITVTGFDGKVYETTEPINCLGIVSAEDREAAAGKACIHFAGSSFQQDSGSVEVWLFGGETLWTMTLLSTNGVWSVTNVETGTQAPPGEPRTPTP